MLEELDAKLVEDAVRQAGTPYLVASATILGLINLRQTDMATRAQAAVAEYRKEKEGQRRPDRLFSLTTQERLFVRRHRLLGGAFFLMSIALALYVAALAGIAISYSLVLVSTPTSLAFFVGGLGMLISEFARAPGTPNLQCKDDVSADPPKPLLNG